MTARLVEIDVAKGIGILLVVFGHSWIVGHEIGQLYYVIYSFHVPLFFFLSGVVFNPNQSLKYLIISKTDSLIKPYWATLLLIAPLYILFKKIPVSTYLLGAGYGNGTTVVWAPLWFLPHLWALNIFSWTFIRLTNIHRQKGLLKIVMLVALLATGYYVLKWLESNPHITSGAPVVVDWGKSLYPGLPLSMDIILVSAFYFTLGFLSKSKLIDVNEVRLLFLLVGFVLIHLFSVVYVDLNIRKYDGLVWTTLTALVGIYLVLGLSKLLSQYKVPSRFLSYIGTASLIILIFHGPFQNGIFYVLNQNIKVHSYLFSVLAFAGGVFLPLIVLDVIRKTRWLRLLYMPVSNKWAGQTVKNLR